MVPSTRFTSLAAVETWDTRFRWRHGRTLHDTTVDMTWRRVADTVAVVEGTMAPLWAHRFVAAFSRWRLLPDERLLASAGTDKPLGDLAGLAAVLNLAAFIRPGPSGRARLDGDQLLATATLAVRLLDDALLRYGVHGNQDLRVGFIGLAEALRRLGTPYGSERARQFAVAVAGLLAEGCLRGNIELAVERGPQAALGADATLRTVWHRRALPEPLLLAAARHGGRHARVTALDHHPDLARFANDVPDTLEPLAADLQGGQGNAIGVARSRIGVAIQPWFDARIPDIEPGAGGLPGVADIHWMEC